MNEIDPKIRADAARRYLGLRRRYWRFFRVAISLLAVDLVLSAVGPRLGLDVGDWLVDPFAIGFVLCAFGSLITLPALRNFRCPRCGERFTRFYAHTRPIPACEHCDLNLL
ncbi:hypothetical protein TA3x_003938 [Tundrisphaera sp. TA3]|uniref:hypothetical protein n=1 Tax=Tundrisphaera sp. TA3 TaxID=3435775 RepID=UPI003EB81725